MVVTISQTFGKKTEIRISSDNPDKIQIWQYTDPICYAWTIPVEDAVKVGEALIKVALCAIERSERKSRATPRI